MFVNVAAEKITPKSKNSKPKIVENLKEFLSFAMKKGNIENASKATIPIIILNVLKIGSGEILKGSMNFPRISGKSRNICGLIKTPDTEIIPDSGLKIFPAPEKSTFRYNRNQIITILSKGAIIILKLSLNSRLWNTTEYAIINKENANPEKSDNIDSSTKSPESQIFTDARLLKYCMQ